VLALDFRSHGRSDRIYEPSTCSAALLAADVVALLDQVQCPRASIFGFSMGGGVALQLAIDHPERVTGLVVGGVGDAAINALHDSDELSRIIAAFAAKDALPDPTTPWRLRRIAELAGNDPKALLPFLRCGGWPGGLAETRPIAAPTLIIIAEHDQYMNATEAIRRWLAPAEIVTITGRDHHDVLLDDRVRTAVTSFLKHLGKPEAHLR
jgi:pimeloyl-ACP methyl ester carboxylesterase